MADDYDKLPLQDKLNAYMVHHFGMSGGGPRGGGTGRTITEKQLVDELYCELTARGKPSDKKPKTVKGHVNKARLSEDEMAKVTKAMVRKAYNNYKKELDNIGPQKRSIKDKAKDKVGAALSKMKNKAKT